MVDNSTNGSTDGPTPEEALSSRMKLLRQGIDMLKIGGAGAGMASIAGIRMAMPLIEGYASVRRKEVKDGDKPGMAGLTKGEEVVLRTAGEKVLLEMLEITSQTHPAYDGAPAYVARGEDGARQPIHLAHLMSLGIATRGVFESWSDDDETTHTANTDKTDEQVLPPSDRSVAYLAVAPGEYGVSAGPLTPTDMRRAAMRHRTYYPPQPAMLETAGGGYAMAPSPSQGANAAAMYSVRAGAGSMSMPAGAAGAPAYGSVRSGKCAACGGGAAACTCGAGGGSGFVFPPARYEADGVTCAPTNEISCDTKWRMRECLKIALCDMLRCASEELCEDGEIVSDPDLGKCIERFFCTFLACLPEAICPPPEKECVPEKIKPACDCNFAVSE